MFYERHEIKLTSRVDIPCVFKGSIITFNQYFKKKGVETFSFKMSSKKEKLDLQNGTKKWKTG